MKADTFKIKRICFENKRELEALDWKFTYTLA